MQQSPEQTPRTGESSEGIHSAQQYFKYHTCLVIHKYLFIIGAYYLADLYLDDLRSMS